MTLIESEEKFRTLAEESPNMVFIIQGGHVVYTNNRAVEQIGYQKDEFYDPNFDILSIVDSENHNLVSAIIQRHEVGAGVEPYEFTLVTRADERIEAIVNTRLIHFSGDQAILAIITDITERKRAEERMAYLANS